MVIKEVRAAASFASSSVTDDEIVSRQQFIFLISLNSIASLASVRLNCSMVKTFLKADFAFEKLVSDILTNTDNIPCRGRPLWEIQGDLTRIPKDCIFSLDCFIFPAYIFPQFTLIST